MSPPVVVVVGDVICLSAFCALSAALLSSATAFAAAPDLGPGVVVFSPSMPAEEIEAKVGSIAARQVANQFGPERFAILFQPGVYGSKTRPLHVKVGYYTAVAGLGRQPLDVVVNGSIDVDNQCDPTGCFALNNFWRSLSNLSIVVDKTTSDCEDREIWAVSQAAPIRRVSVDGDVSLSDPCTRPAYASGGFIADSLFTNGRVVNGAQQQWLTRNSALDGWTGGFWNQVFSGVIGAPAQCFPASPTCGGPFTRIAASRRTREAPYLFVDASGRFGVFVPAAEKASVGPTWSKDALTPGAAISIDRFFVAKPSDGARAINEALARGDNLILTPGVYRLEEPLVVPRPDTVVFGLGFPTIIPEEGEEALRVEAERGVVISGVIVDAGPKLSPALLTLGAPRGERSGGGDHVDASDPSALSDVFFRIGGAAAGSTKRALVVNSDDAILDDIWAWRADHGAGIGWSLNVADTGIEVNGDRVTAYGLFVEHFEKTDVIWNGDDGALIFLQNETPHDPPNQAEWGQAPGGEGYPAFKLKDGVKTFVGYGMASYGNFAADVTVASAFEVPSTLPASSLNGLTTVFLSGTAKGAIRHVVNGVGGSASPANPDVAVTVANYP